MPFCGRIAKHPRATRGHDAKRHGQQTRLERSETEIINDNGTKRLETAVGDIDENVEDDNEPDARVYEGIDDLIPLPYAVGDTRSVLGEPLHGMEFLLGRQKVGSHGTVWQ